jgi:hypothetical protein
VAQRRLRSGWFKSFKTFKMFKSIPDGFNSLNDWNPRSAGIYFVMNLGLIRLERFEHA